MKNLLLIDDSKVVRNAVKYALQNRFKILEAHNGEKAIQFLRKNTTISVVITDYMMPLKNGLEVIRWIKDHYTPKAKIILLTGHEPIKDSGLQAGADHVLIKPFDVVELVTIVSEFQ